MNDSHHPLTYDALASAYGLEGDLRETFLLNVTQLRAIGQHDEIAVARMILDRVRTRRIATPDELGLLLALLERASDDELERYFASFTMGVEDLRAAVSLERADQAMPALLADLEARLTLPGLTDAERTRLETAAEAMRRAVAGSHGDNPTGAS